MALSLIIKFSTLIIINLHGLNVVNTKNKPENNIPQMPSQAIKSGTEI